MEKRSNYEELLSVLDFFKNSEITGEERQLFYDLSELLDVNRNSRIMAQAFYHDEGVLGLIKKIDASIQTYGTELKKYESKGNSFLDFSSTKVNELQGKIRALEDLKGKILTYVDCDIDCTDLVEKCAGALAIGSFYLPKYYGKSLVTKGTHGFRINKEIVSSVYNFLADDQQVAQLEQGVHIMQDIREATREVNVYDEALRYKAVIYRCKDDIFQYNSIKARIASLNATIETYEHGSNYEKDLRKLDWKINDLKSNKFKSLIHSCAIAELEEERPFLVEMIENKKRCIELRSQLIEELAIVKRRLVENGLEKIIMRVETDELFYNRNNTATKNSLGDRFPSFNNDEDIDRYYQSLNRFMKTAQEKLRESTQEKENFDSYATRVIRTLLYDDFETAVNILDLKNAKKRNDITPAMALYVLEMIIAMEDADLSDLCIPEDPCIVDDTLKSSIDMNVVGFTKEYLDIIQPKKEKTYKK